MIDDHLLHTVVLHHVQRLNIMSIFCGLTNWRRKSILLEKKYETLQKQLNEKKRFKEISISFEAFAAKETSDFELLRLREKL